LFNDWSTDLDAVQDQEATALERNEGKASLSFAHTPDEGNNQAGRPDWAKFRTFGTFSLKILNENNLCYILKFCVIKSNKILRDETLTR
jgi:hypothetical protein